MRSVTGNLVLFVIGCTALAPAAGAAAGSVAVKSVGATSVEWIPTAGSYERIDLVVSGPGGYRLQETFPAGLPPRFDLFGRGGRTLADGLYKYELRVVPQIDAATRELMAAARAANDESAVARLRREGRLPAEALVESGFVRVLGGAFLAPDGAVEAAQGGPYTEATVLTNSDGVIRNSLCVGFDCPDSFSPSDTTILLMENNTRIKFDDTSASGFPNNDWEIEANSSSSGGPNWFAVNDCGNSSQGGCADDPVFAIEAGVRANALYVESDGDVGVGTSNPVLDIHVVTGNTPSLRLDQDGSSGFQPQVWDVGANEGNFFVRDVTAGSSLALRIFPGAPSNSLSIAFGGKVGLGTPVPTSALHLRRTDGSAHVKIEEASGAAAARELFRLANNGPPQFRFEDTSAAVTWAFAQQGGGFVINKIGSGGNELTLQGDGRLKVGPGGFLAFNLAPTGALTIAGTLTQGSSRSIKSEIVPVAPAEVLERLIELPLATWSYTREPADGRHLGPMAEDFRLAFGLGADDAHLAPGDAAGVALAAIQGLNDKLERENAELRTANAELESRLAAVEAALGARGPASAR